MINLNVESKSAVNGTLSNKLLSICSCTRELIGGSREMAYPTLLVRKSNITNRYVKPHVNVWAQKRYGLADLYIHTYMYYTRPPYLVTFKMLYSFHLH